MTREFADTSYYLALLGPADTHHRKAVAFSQRSGARYVTTEYVLLEVGNSLCRSADRALFVEFLAGIRADPLTEVVPGGPALWDRAADLYARRMDKDWSVTDCASFAVMADRGLTEALTADHHFAQAGFVPLLV